MPRHLRLAKLVKVLSLCIWWAIGIATFVGLCNYGSDAYTRYSRMSGCVWNTVPTPDDRPYAVRFCYLTKDVALVRVYDISGRELLAERTFFELDRARFYWTPRAFGYSNERYGGLISIPPTLVDRLRAKLP
jgi:hypothetical protein